MGKFFWTFTGGVFGGGAVGLIGGSLIGIDMVVEIAGMMGPNWGVFMAGIAFPVACVLAWMSYLTIQESVSKPKIRLNRRY